MAFINITTTSAGSEVIVGKALVFDESGFMQKLRNRQDAVLILKERTAVVGYSRLVSLRQPCRQIKHFSSVPARVVEAIPKYQNYSTVRICYIHFKCLAVRSLL